MPLLKAAQRKADEYDSVLTADVRQMNMICVLTSENREMTMIACSLQKSER